MRTCIGRGALGACLALLGVFGMLSFSNHPSPSVTISTIQLRYLRPTAWGFSSETVRITYRDLGLTYTIPSYRRTKLGLIEIDTLIPYHK